MKKKLRRILATVLSVLMVAGVVLPVQAKAQEGPYDPFTHLEDAYAYAYGGLLDLRLLNKWLRVAPDGRALTVAELRGVEQLWTSAANDEQAPEGPSINVELLELIYLDLGAIQIPLLGDDSYLEPLFSDINLGLLNEYASAPAATKAHGASGVINGEGGLEVTNPADGNATINLLSLLRLEPGFKDIINTAGLELGAISAVAINPDDSEFPDYDVTCDPSLTTTDIGMAEESEIICHSYQVADAIVVIDAPILGDVTDLLTGVLGNADTLINDALSLGGLFDTLLGTVTGLLRLLSFGSINLELTVTAEVPVEDILGGLLNEELSDASGLVKIDLQEGTIKVDLQQLHLEGLNNLDPNTPLLSSDDINDITASVLSLLTDSATDNPNGLMALLESALIGDVDPVTGENLRTGGLYDTELSIVLDNRGVLGSITGSLEISGTLGDMFSGDFTYSGTGILSVVNLLGSVINTLTGGVGATLEELLFTDSNPIVSTLLGSASNALLTNIVNLLEPVLRQVLDPLLNIIINRQTIQEVEHGSVFTVSAVEVNVLDLGTSGEVIHLPLATAAVMAQHRKLIDLDLDVAKTGNGRGLYTGDYTYDLVCEADNGSVLDELVYEAGNVGDGFSFTGTPEQLQLTGTTGGLSLSDPLRVAPGAQCTVTATPDQPGLGTWDALRPTGAPLTRTPYTYFLDTDANNNVVVSGETPVDEPTDLTSDGISFDGDRVVVDTDEVGNEWKNHSFTFVVPEDAEESHRVSIIHAYDIDTRDIVVSKTVAGEEFSDKEFAFDYSFDGGQNWTSAPGNPIGHDEDFTLVDVPVLDLEALNADPSVQAPAEVMIREALGAEEAGPVVSWIWDGDGLTPLSSDDDGYDANFATASFTAGPVAAPSTVPTPNQNLGVTNSYAAITVDKHIDGELGTLDNTTLIPEDATKMTIRYTVKNTGAVPLETIRIVDESLWTNPPFTLPGNITRDPDTGAVTGAGCTLAFDAEGEATCFFEVTLKADPGDFFHYKAADAEVTAVATVIIDDRTITATATDKHGAMRLPGILGQLPATGVTTLVWVMALGLIAALTALALYVRSRRK